MLVNAEARAQLAVLAAKFPPTIQLEFQHMAASHPLAHIAKRFPTGFRQAACGASFRLSDSVPAEDGDLVCQRCAYWFRIRSEGG